MEFIVERLRLQLVMTNPALRRHFLKVFNIHRLHRQSCRNCIQFVVLLNSYGVASYHRYTFLEYLEFQAKTEAYVEFSLFKREKLTRETWLKSVPFVTSHYTSLYVSYVQDEKLKS